MLKILRLPVSGTSIHGTRLNIRRVNFEIGLSTPILATPLNYLGDEDSDE